MRKGERLESRNLLTLKEVQEDIYFGYYNLMVWIYHSYHLILSTKTKQKQKQKQTQKHI